MKQIYPSLETFGFSHLFGGYKMPELRPFLEQNSTIKTVSICFNLFWENRLDLLNSNVKLDVLFINMVINNKCSYPSTFPSAPFCELLQNLHTNGFYKTLKLRTKNISMLQEMDSCEVIDTLDTLLCEFRTEYVGQLSWFNSVKYLYFFQMPPKSLVNLNHFKIKEIKFEDIVQLIRYWPRLKIIRIREKIMGNLDLVKLNNERKKLQGTELVTPLTIYVPDEIFLKAKWSTNVGNLKYIELKRLYSYKIEDEFHR